MLITASRLPLLVHCAATAHPDTWQEKDKPNAAMAFGNAVHLLMEDHIDDTWEHTPSSAAMVSGVDDEEIPRLERVWANLLQAIDGKHFIPNRKAEVGLAFNVETGEAKQLHLEGKRMYTDELPWICGTADIVGVDGDTSFVQDLKTGNSRSDSYEWQLLMLGLAWKTITKTSVCIVSVMRAGEVEAGVDWEVGIDDLSAARVAETLSRVARDSLSAARNAGQHCNDYYCKARKKCEPYQQAKKGKTL